MTSYYNEIMLELSDYAKELSLGYIDSWGHEEKTREAAFAKLFLH